MKCSCYTTVKMIVLLGGLAAGPLMAQQKPHYTQYIINPFIINPALAGIENYVDVKLSHRRQWVGIQDGPVTSYLTLQGPIGKDDYISTPTSLDGVSGNPRGKMYWENYTAPSSHHGIGLQLVNDVTGPLSNTSGYLTYAYHQALSGRTSLSSGIGLGFSRYNLDVNKLQFSDAVVDPAVYGSGILNNLRFDMMAGLYLYSPDFFISLSAQQLLPQKIDFTNGYIRPETGKTVPHFFASAGYRFLAGADFNVLPSVMVKYVEPIPVQVEANIKLQYRGLAWLGASYRHKDGFAGMAGLIISNRVNIGYAYDYTTSRLNNYSKGTHEVIIGFLLGKTPDGCPRNLW